MKPLTACIAASLTGGVALAQQTITAPEVRIEAQARDVPPLLDTPVAATVVERDALERRRATTFGELIGDAPGVTIEDVPRGIAQEPNTRGSQDEQIVPRLDGGRFNFKQAHRGRFLVDPDLVQRVEVARHGGWALGAGDN